MQSLLEQLNPQQREAVQATEGPLLIIAGAGSGKTRVITHRIAYLIRERGVQPWQIFAATFTNKAAREMRDRVFSLVDGPSMARLSISTFHSFCATLLRREAEKAGLTPRFTILDDTEQKGVARACLERLDIDPKALSPAQALERIGQAKIRLLGPGEVDDFFAGAWAGDLTAVYREYERMLSTNDAVDFDDLLLKVVRLLESDAEARAHYEERYRYLLVDEYQDTNVTQFRLLELLAGTRRNLCVVGDEDQSIYSWRGAEIANILNFEKAFPGARIIRLEQNYRSTKTILSLAEGVIVRNKERLGKALWTEAGEGPQAAVVSAATSMAEASFVVSEIRRLRDYEGLDWDDIAVFYRVNALSRSVEDQLRAANIPYRVVGGVRFYDRAEIKDILAYLSVVATPSAGFALARIVNKPKRGVGEKTLRTLEDFAARNGLPLSFVLADKEALAAVPKKAAGAIATLCGQIEEWRGEADRIPLADLVERILADTGYIESLGEDAASLEVITRKENITELLASIREYEKSAESPSLLDYLERVALTVSDDDKGAPQESVSLMTLHSAKGLEFKAVFLIGLEEGIFPSPRAAEERGNIEEERRLFYVGVTRARERLYLTWAKTRMMYGRTDWTTPSLFLHEAPGEYCETLDLADSEPIDAWLAPRRGRSGVDRRGPSRPRAPQRPAPSAPCRFQPGQRVEHVFLGQGVIQDIKGDGVRRAILIRFEDGQDYEILERYGDLKIVG